MKTGQRCHFWTLVSMVAILANHFTATEGKTLEMGKRNVFRNVSFLQPRSLEAYSKALLGLQNRRHKLKKGS